MTATEYDTDPAHYTWPAAEATFYGRHVWTLGEEGDEGVLVAGHGARALAAFNAHQRYLQGHDWHRGATGAPGHAETWMRLFEECGCTAEKHAEHEATNVNYCDGDCDHYGLPPCRDQFAWMCDRVSPTDEGAVPVTEIRW